MRRLSALKPGKGSIGEGSTFPDEVRAELVRDHDMRLLKLYMVFGYPGETMDDFDEMIEFLRELSTICRVALGMSPLVAKKNTPLDGVPFEEKKLIKSKIKHLHKELGANVDIRSTSQRWSWIDHQMSQGGFDMADAAEEAYKSGANFGTWKRAIKRHKKKAAPLARAGNKLRKGALLPDEFSRIPD